MTSVLINAGIRPEQHDKLKKMMTEEPDRFKSINAVVQEAVILFINDETAKKDSNITKKDTKSVLEELEHFFENILLDKLEDKIILNDDELKLLNGIIKQVKFFKDDYYDKTKSQRIMSAIDIKEYIDVFIESLNSREENQSKGTLKEYYEKIRLIMKDLVRSFK